MLITNTGVAAGTIIPLTWTVSMDHTSAGHDKLDLNVFTLVLNCDEPTSFTTTLILDQSISTTYTGGQIDLPTIATVTPSTVDTSACLELDYVITDLSSAPNTIVLSINKLSGKITIPNISSLNLVAGSEYQYELMIQD